MKGFEFSLPPLRASMHSWLIGKGLGLDNVSDITSTTQFMIYNRGEKKYLALNAVEGESGPSGGKCIKVRERSNNNLTLASAFDGSLGTGDDETRGRETYKNM